MSRAEQQKDGVTRLSFIKGAAGVAAGTAAVAVPAAGVLASEQKGVATEPSGPTQPEPVVAYVRDAKRGEVTVVSGTSETTYRDPALTKRLLAAAPEQTSTGGGELDVVTP